MNKLITAQPTAELTGWCNFPTSFSFLCVMLFYLLLQTSIYFIDYIQVGSMESYTRAVNKWNSSAWTNNVFKN
jgi:hypothetical protein